MTRDPREPPSLGEGDRPPEDDEGDRVADQVREARVEERGEQDAGAARRDLPRPDPGLVEALGVERVDRLDDPHHGDHRDRSAGGSARRDRAAEARSSRGMSGCARPATCARPSVARRERRHDGVRPRVRRGGGRWRRGRRAPRSASSAGRSSARSSAARSSASVLARLVVEPVEAGGAGEVEPGRGRHMVLEDVALAGHG